MKKSKPKGKLGSGSRFKALKGKLSHEKGITNPGALAAAIGRKKYSKKKFQSLAAKGKKRHSKGKNMVKKALKQK